MEVTGVLELSSRLQSISESIAQDIFDRVSQAGEDVANEARSLCPVAIVNGGQLRDSIFAKTSKIGRVVTCKVGSPLEYAAPVELGTAHMGARPFLQPALCAQGLGLRL